MKQILICLTMCGLLFSSCSKDEGPESNLSNCEIVLDVVDQNGNDLMDPDTPGSIAGNEIWIEYKGETYPLINPIYGKRNPQPGPVALRYKNVGYGTQIHKLVFGEFSPNSGYKAESFVIHWADGTSDTITFDCYILPEKRDNPAVVNRIYLNGNLYSEDNFNLQIVK